MKLDLNTSYDEIGNVSGRQIDTLALAAEGRCWDDIRMEMHHYDHYTVDAAIDQWKKTDAEKEFRSHLTPEQAAEYAGDLDQYEQDLDDYKDEEIEKVTGGEYWDLDTPLAKEIQEWLNAEEEKQYNDWISGNAYEGVDGVIPTINRELLDEDVTLSYDQETDAVTVQVDDPAEYRAYLEDEHWIELDEYPSDEEAIKETIEYIIESKARSKYATRKAEEEKRRKEWKEKQEYKEKRRKEAEERKRKELQVIADNK